MPTQSKFDFNGFKEAVAQGQPREEVMAKFGLSKALYYQRRKDSGVATRQKTRKKTPDFYQVPVAVQAPAPAKDYVIVTTLANLRGVLEAFGE